MSLLLLANPAVSDQTIWLIVGVGGMIGLYLLMRPRAKKGDPLSAVPKFPLARQRSVEQQMNSLLVELSEMARQITAQLDTRAAKLELLIKEADQKLAELRALTEAPGNSHHLPTFAVIDSMRGIDSSQESSDARLTKENMAQPDANGAATAAADHRHAEVYGLADAGRSANEIARALHRPAGEIELILALRAK